MCVTTNRMHADEIPTSAALARRLLEAQHPQWAGLPVRPVRSWGTDHTLYRLGEALVVRLPRIGWAAGQAELETTWLPRLAPHLPVKVPEVLARGQASEEYPFTWSVQTWLEGTDARAALDADLLDRRDAAHDLAGLVECLTSLPLSDDVPASPRGRPLAEADEAVRSTLPQVADLVDGPSTLRLWEAALEAPPPEAATWVHGDLLPGNLLVKEGRLSALIDWGSLGAGDPAVELLAAWHVLDGPSRRDLRTALPEALREDAAWARGRGWVVLQAVMALAYYRTSNPMMMRQAGLALTEALGGT